MKDYSKSTLRRHNKTEKLRQRRQALQKGAISNKQPLCAEEDVTNPLNLIRREIAIMKKLDHPNIVSLIEVLDDPDSDSLYMILEYCAKGAIMSSDPCDVLTCTQSPYTEEQCRLYFRDMILGIEYLHSQGIIHRDIKADNILLDEDDVVKIADFGVSEILDPDNDIITKTAGSPAYMAPELAALSSHAELKKHAVGKGIDVSSLSGKSTDIWSMGVTLYFLIHGQLPFRGETLVDLYDQIVTEDFYIAEDANPDLKDLLRRILAKLPQDRITMDELRVHPWVTRNGEDNLLSKEENAADNITPVTEEDLFYAIEFVQGLMEPSLAIAKLRRLHGWRDYVNSDSINSRAASLSPQVRATEPLRSPSPIDETLSMYKLTRALEEVVSKSEYSRHVKSYSTSTQSDSIRGLSLNASNSSVDNIDSLRTSHINTLQSLTGNLQAEPLSLQPPTLQPCVTHAPMRESPAGITPSESASHLPMPEVATPSSGSPSQLETVPPLPATKVSRHPSRTRPRALLGLDKLTGIRSRSLDPESRRRL